jgi:outer membrane biosynthesis protein TonB
MTAALPQSRRIGIAGTAFAHGALIVLAWIAGRNAHANSSPVYAVSLVAAPRPSAGPAPDARTQPPPPKDVAPVVRQKAVKQPPPKATVKAKQPEPAPATKTVETPLPNAVPSTGRDVVTLTQPGIVFPYQDYIDKIANEVMKRWNQSGFRPGLYAQIAFIIMKDGSVPSVSITVDKTSGMSVFDDRAMGAIETAAALHAFGPLPSGFNSASLPVVFNFRVIPKGTP